jgi:tetraacyldisaccharide 4'-kinase
MRPPAFWRHDEGGRSGVLARALLSPLGAVYAWSVARRIRRTEPVDCGLPVICVGNITMGGTGKTPVAIALLDALKAMGFAPHALTRGYGGSIIGPEPVDAERHGAAEVGDEPLLLARAAPVWVSRDRPAGAAAAKAAGAELIVMDDGHQNPTLLKTLSFIVVDGGAGWGANRVFPAGPLREPVAAGLARADAVIIMTSGPEDEPAIERLGLADLEKPVFHAWLEPEATPPDGKLFAFAGIGRPEKFYDALSAAGGELANSMSFPDHHVFSDRDLASLREMARDYEARLITTEKDWVRLPADMQAETTAWPVRARFSQPAMLEGMLRDMMDGAAQRG